MGHHLIDRHFHHAMQMGQRDLDIGGGQDYKARYAPVLGERSTVKVWPAMLLPIKHGMNAMRDVKRRLRVGAGETAPAIE
jgi:hypothetical protein